jgi:hypothetical protein
MRRVGIFGITWTSLVGLIFGIIFILFAFKVGISFSKTLLPSDDKIRLENSMDALEEAINDIKLNDTKTVLFDSVKKEVYLVASNNDSNVDSCFRRSCIALCYDKNCEKLVFDNPWFVNNGAVFENPGVVAVLNKAEGNQFLLSVKNSKSGIHISVSYQK